MYQVINSNLVVRLSDGLNIPVEPKNREYRHYEKWLKEGNTPLPADIVVKRISIDEKIDALLDGGVKLEELKARIAAELIGVV